LISFYDYALSGSAESSSLQGRIRGRPAHISRDVHMFGALRLLMKLREQCRLVGALTRIARLACGLPDG
jgi:hypothetical protein